MTTAQQLVFVEGPEVDEVVHDHATSAVDIAASKFRLTLDFGEASIEHVEAMAATFHANVAAAPIDMISHVARSLGSYLQLPT